MLAGVTFIYYFPFLWLIAFTPSKNIFFFGFFGGAI
jgi:hypothetical protein